MSDHLTTDRQILRGRREIAQFLGVAMPTLDMLIDKRVIRVFRPTGNPKGMIMTTKKLLLECVEKAALATAMK